MTGPSTAAGLADQLAAALRTSSADALIVTDRDGVIRFWNPGAVRIFGFPVEEAVGQSLDLIIPPKLRDRHWDGYHRVMATGETRYGPAELLSVPAMTRNGDRISVEFTIMLLRDAAGQGDGMAAILRDVTARMDELRELRRRLAVVGGNGKARTSG
ncbi:signal transduction histidine kinase [Agaricicola taiwanensis]|uniref:Signal transduction histidine kinase n=1 Tax=Agaricicola taiwanensis TaxID=591372 RepID=A0A8J2YM67_9RHOB|nr:PAS domain-containing protein [Agaricicola taiwanensis]GGE52492.1 signal transduction histidine kinase [Agaricicola taiwanensis]